MTIKEACFRNLLAMAAAMAAADEERLRGTKTPPPGAKHADPVPPAAGARTGAPHHVP